MSLAEHVTVALKVFGIYNRRMVVKNANVIQSEVLTLTVAHLRVNVTVNRASVDKVVINVWMDFMDFLLMDAKVSKSPIEMKIHNGFFSLYKFNYDSAFYSIFFAFQHVMYVQILHTIVIQIPEDVYVHQ